MALRTVGKHHTVRSFFQWWINGLQPCPYGRDLYRLVRPGNFCNTPAFFLFSSNEIFLRILLIYKNYSYLCPRKSVV